jgi:uncharacterized membrane protein
VNTAVRARPPVDARGRVPVVAPVDPAVPAWVLPLIVVLGVALRVWRIVSNGLTFDESFTALAGRLSVSDLFSYLRHNDSHPPLDYLIRAPFARAGASDFLLRSPSLLFSCAALALFAWWMRGRSWLGVIATALMAVSTFQVLYGGDARMYALLQLLGVTAAIVTERWLRAPAPWHAWAIGVVLLVALFDHVSGALLGAGLVAVAGFRRDREAWRWRLVVTGAGLVWLAVWGPVMLDQLGGQWASWIPRTTPLGFAQTVSRQITLAEAIAPLVLAAVVGGGVVLCRRDRVLGRLWLALGALPFALAALLGLFASFLFDRTLTLASWAPLLAIAFLLDGARRRWRTAGTAIAVTLVLIVTMASCTFLLDKRWDYDLSVERLEQVARPGDVIAVRPARYGILVDWRIGVRGERPTRHVLVADLGDADSLLVIGAAKSGRVWLLTPLGSRTDFPGYTRCAPRWTDKVTEILCLRRSS